MICNLTTNSLRQDGIALSRIWPDFVNMKKRSEKEVPFIIERIKAFQNPRILDSCMGIGATSIPLKLLPGSNLLVSNEIDANFAAVAKEKARKLGIRLKTASRDWRSNDFIGLGNFECILCLGNSLTYLFKKEDQLLAIGNFYKMLSDGGTLLIDERNYAHHFLNGRGSNYVWSGEFVYCGKDKVDAKPSDIRKNLVVMRYEHLKNGLVGRLRLYPFKEGELYSLLQKAGFSDIQAFGDYSADFAPQKPEFITYVCTK